MKTRFLLITLLFASVYLGARENVGPPRPNTHQPNNPDGLRNNCSPGTQSKDLKINNVRARLRNGGDMWWDGQRARYIVPQVAAGEIEVSSLYAGSVWLGAVDANGNQIVAAQTYRQSGNDFWPGPLSEYQQGGQTDQATCAAWNLMFECFGTEIIQQRSQFDPANIPANILYWPGRGNRFIADRYPNLNSDQMDRNLAPFVDINNNCLYEPDQGEYPVIEVRGCATGSAAAVPDQMIWWVYNDNGNIHTESDGLPMKMEIQCTAFSYVTSDEINNMTFYRYKLINKRSVALDSTWFAVWSDPDLGCDDDDYIGCDTTQEVVTRNYILPNGRTRPETITRNRDLGIVYNADANDQRTGCDAPGYGTTIPALGLDYFRGPLETLVKDRNGNGIAEDFIDYDSVMTDCSGIVDTLWRRYELGMSNFMYYVNDGSTRGNPASPNEFLNYMRSTWRNGTKLSVGGSGLNPGGGLETRYAFPGDPANSTSWNMCNSGVPPADMRFLHVSGPFQLLPGDVNELITGVVWIPDHITGTACQTFQGKLRQADVLAQALFDNCFKLVEGPEAPDLDIVEMDKELILALSYDGRCNNGCGFDYSEVDIRAQAVIGSDQTYNIEGYKIYQLSQSNVTDLGDPQLARLIFQCDVANGIGRIINYERDDALGQPIPALKTEQWSNGGLRHTFKFTSDQFSTTNDKTLKNHKKYYFKVVAYAHNEFQPYNRANGSGQDKPYLQGRFSKSGTGIPRINSPEYYGIELNSAFGSSPKVTRYDGKGNIGNFLEIDNVTEVENEVTSPSGQATKIVYSEGNAPIDVIVHSPLRVTNDSCVLTMFDTTPGNATLDGVIKWSLRQLDANNNTYAQWTSMTTLNQDFDQAIFDLGISVRASIQPNPGCDPNDVDGFVGGGVSYPDGTTPWFAPFKDGPYAPNAFLFSQLTNFFRNDLSDPTPNITAYDPTQDFTRLNETGWYPFMLTSCYRDSVITGAGLTPAEAISPNYLNTRICNQEFRGANKCSYMGKLRNVNVVLTPDKSKWSRCIVVETASPVFTEGDPYPNLLAPPGYNNGTAERQFHLRRSPSVDKDGRKAGDPGYNAAEGDLISSNNMGWFPGYAYDVDSGERLNVFFGENTFYHQGLVNDLPTVASLDAATQAKFLRGNDMLFNPSDLNNVDIYQRFPGVPMSSILNFSVGGGWHNVYVGSTKYDDCSEFRRRLANGNNSEPAKLATLREIIWTAMGMMAPGADMANGVPPTNMTVKLRVKKSFNHHVGNNSNGGYPMYGFKLDKLAPTMNSRNALTTALDLVNVVPNPYYAYSEYEGNETQQLVRITNLPSNTVVNIYSLDGKFVRQYKTELDTRQNQGTLADRFLNVNVDENDVVDASSQVPVLNPVTGLYEYRGNRIERQNYASGNVTWDLKNFYGVPVSSGVYLINVTVPGIGERTLKSFIISRAFDSQRL